MRIKINNLNYKKDKKYIFKNLNLDIQFNKSLIISGESGSGKTIFIQILTNLIKTKADIKINNIDFKKWHKNNNYSYVMQEPEKQLWNLTIKKDLLNNLKINNFDEKINQLLPNFGLEFDILDKNYSNLSGGELRKIGLINSLLSQENKLLILDEPTASLDNEFKIEFLSFLKNYLNKRKIKAIIITHDLDVINFFSEKIIIFENQDIIFNGNFTNFKNYALKYEKYYYLDQKSIVKSKIENITKKRIENEDEIFKFIKQI